MCFWLEDGTQAPVDTSASPPSNPLGFCLTLAESLRNGITKVRLCLQKLQVGEVSLHKGLAQGYMLGVQGTGWGVSLWGEGRGLEVGSASGVVQPKL